MTTNLEQLHRHLMKKDWPQAKAACRSMFGCSDPPLDELAATLTESGFFAVCALLESIRQAPADQRPALGLPLECFIDLDLPTDDQKQRALEAAQIVLRALPA